MSNYQQLVSSMQAVGPNTFKLTIPENWMQGRTTYGGLSAALCLYAVNKTQPDLPPIRSAQINFIGPAGGEVNITVKVLRQGKSVTFVNAELRTELGLATHSIFCFGSSRPSQMDQVFLPTPDCCDPSESRNFFEKKEGPVFTQNFESLLAKGGLPMSGSNKHEHFIWTRFRETLDEDVCSLLAIADMPPPAVLPMFEKFAPISSMTWMLNFVCEKPTTQDQWWLMRTSAEHAQNGYSSQDMQIWNSERELVVTGRQNVAIFY